ncbi:MAG: hypothetical protein ACWA6X_00165 [Bauldia sp.]|jgi:uncharacterized protein (DUF433 family)
MDNPDKPAIARLREGTVTLGVGSYTAVEAARLLGIPARKVRRWLAGYVYREPNGDQRAMPPLWEVQLPSTDTHLELGFRDLIELRFVKGFVAAGVGLGAIRKVLDFARDCVGDSHPFSTRRFKTDGRRIFLDSLERIDSQTELLELRSRQYVFRQVVERTFKDLDVDRDRVARWRPYQGKPSIVIDPQRSFGQPIAAEFGVPTVVISEAVDAEGSQQRVAALFEISPEAVRDAVRFEESLKAAA